MLRHTRILFDGLTEMETRPQHQAGLVSLKREFSSGFTDENIFLRDPLQFLEFLLSSQNGDPPPESVEGSS